MPPPLRRLPSRPANPSPEPGTAAPGSTSAPPPASASGVPSFLNFGGTAKAAAQASADNAGRGFVPEFFITKAEMAQAKAKSEPGVTVRVHFTRNYNDLREQVSVARISVLEGGNWKGYTSAGADCAVAAAGVTPIVKPVYILVDHREFIDSQTKQKVSDRVRMFIAPPTFVGVMDSAIKNLAENLGIPPEKVDVTRHEAKITKIGEGRNTTWSLDFLVAPKPMTQTALNNVAKMFKEGYHQKLAEWLAPNPRYLISKGGTYVKPARNAQGSSYDAHPAPGGPAADGSDEPPY